VKVKLRKNQVRCIAGWLTDKAQKQKIQGQPSVAKVVSATSSDGFLLSLLFALIFCQILCKMLQKKNT